MSDDPRAALHAALVAALRAHRDGVGEVALERAYDAARLALQAGLGLLDLDAVHQSATEELLAEIAAVSEVHALLRASGEIRRESLTPFEMAQSGYREANATLRKLNETLMRAQSQKEQLTAFVVHDLKNPLSGIMLNAMALERDRSLGEETRAVAKGVLHSAQSMNRMVMNLLDISRSEDGALVPRRTNVDLVSLLEEVAKTMLARVVGKDLLITTQFELKQRTLAADLDLLRRVFENLIDNAVRYTPRKGTIALEAKSSAEGVLEIRVRDEGDGVPAEHRERIFEKYVQLESARGANVRTGRGLGLVFCRLAVEAHGGKIWVEAGERTGAVFCIQLPVASK